MALPTAWDVNDVSLPDVDSNGLEVNYRDYSGKHDAVIRTDNPIPSQCKLFYFEIDVINNENNGTIAIGFCSESAERNKMPGCEKNSWGYHSDDGNFFECSVIDIPYGPTFTTGDTIGCCLNFRNNTAFYTKNGVNLGIAFRDLKDNLYPCIGIKSQGASIKANFGYKFKYAAMTTDDIDDDLIKDRWANPINQCNQDQNMPAYLTNTLETNTNNLLRYRGKAYFVMGEYKKALEDLTKLLEIEPNNSFALRYRGETYLLLNEYEKSYADVKILLSTGTYSDIAKVANELWIKGKTVEMASLSWTWIWILSVFGFFYCIFLWPIYCMKCLADCCLGCFLECCCVCLGRRTKETCYRVTTLSVATLSSFSLIVVLLNAGDWWSYVIIAAIIASILLYICLIPWMKSLGVWERRKRRAKNRARAREGQTDSAFGKCEKCNEDNTYYVWCQKCDSEDAIKEILPSGDNDIDNCIKEFQLEAIMHDEVIEWIPFNRLSNIKKIGKGGFGTVFSAIWLDGIRTTVKDRQDKEYTKSREKSSKVALKTLSNSQNLPTADVLQEFKNHMRCKVEGSELGIYGLTQCTENQEHLKAGDYLMVIEFADCGDLSSYLQKNFKKLTWEHKLLRLIEISCDLAKIHKAGYIHRDFHSGNILLRQIGIMKTDVISYITDLGLSEKFGEHISKGDAFGVLPYVAPEILSGDYNIHTPDVDIYGLGVIMVEMSTGQKPFEGDKYDTKLAVKILKGLRPKCSFIRTPDCYIELANKCMQKDPQKRPTAIDVAINLRHQFEYIKSHKKIDKLCVKEKFLVADKAIKNSSMIKQNPSESIFASKSINRNEINLALNEDQPTDSTSILIDE